MSNALRSTVWKRRTAVTARWLHIYISMLSFVVIFFFAVTGLTLNHPDKFGNQLQTVRARGKLAVQWVNPADTARVNTQAIVASLRQTYGITAPLSDVRIDPSQLDVSFKGPGYAADAFVIRATGAYAIEQTRAGFVGLLNDLHRGRDAGPVWSLVIDLAAIFLTVLSLTGLLLLLFLKRKRVSGLLVAAGGLLMLALIYTIWIK